MEEKDFETLVQKVRRDYPEFRFKTGKKFAFRPPRTIMIVDLIQSEKETRTGAKKSYSAVEQKNCSLRLLHELGHATLRHRDFLSDIERLKMERAAWEKAREFCEKYDVEYDEDFIEVELDSYRDWLHQRSKCPICGQTRYQGANGEYYCPFCAENL